MYNDPLPQGSLRDHRLFIWGQGGGRVNNGILIWSLHGKKKKTTGANEFLVFRGGGKMYILHLFPAKSNKRPFFSYLKSDLKFNSSFPPDIGKACINRLQAFLWHLWWPWLRQHLEVRAEPHLTPGISLTELHLINKNLQRRKALARHFTSKHCSLTAATAQKCPD